MVYREDAFEPLPPLPDIPTCASMRSITMTHKFLDLYAWPGLTNQWGCAQASMDVTAASSPIVPVQNTSSAA